ncbi:hypothetical protein BBC27_00445 [Acidithiobacillus ferrivorans]|uniref:Uncharacterized protein n=1 Tax=Acidithiobacillus ferrivorans TaxID=160808 RepID=A0A1B9C1L6_9PROT|nr:hypothetical protein BBC27_00445 [Acidithiobacillus ferrivorans]
MDRKYRQLTSEHRIMIPKMIALQSTYCIAMPKITKVLPNFSPPSIPAVSRPHLGKIWAQIWADETKRTTDPHPLISGRWFR